MVDENGRVLTETVAEGEMCYRGPNVTMGYAICKEDLLKGDEFNGEYHTGDLARRDEDGCYYVTGNHEASTSLYADLRQGMMDQGVVILENERLELTRSGESISVLGVNDPSVHKDFASDSDARIMEGNLNALVKEEDSYTILLSHRPELFDLYVSSGVNLVLSGHAHGGQFRLPFIGGLIAPNQGLCPTYDAGMFSEDGTDMIVSRGIGNSVIPVRFHNRPEIVCVELRRN